MAVSPFRQPGAQTFLPGPGNARPQVTGLPQAGSPLMQQLVKFVQARNPAIVVNEGNVQTNLPERLDVRPGTNFRIPGAGRDLLRQLLQAGLARPERTLSPTDFVLSSPVQRENAVNQQRIRMQLGLRPVVPFVDQFAHMNMSSPSGGGVSGTPAPSYTVPAGQNPYTAQLPQVPVATLPEPAPALPFAQTPVGPMLFPPGPQAFQPDPRRRLLFR